MKNKKHLVKGLVSLILSCYVSQAVAVGAVSRACRYAYIPYDLRGVADAFFIAVGGKKSLISTLTNQTNPDKKYWILESLTTDYFRARYYMYAVSYQYVYMQEERVTFGGSTFPSWWSPIRTISSPGWGSQEISEAMQKDDTFKIYYENRGILTSQRAGHPDIVEDLSKYYKKFDREYQAFAVRGEHHLYDPVTKQTYRLKDTTATDCNIKDFGLRNQGLFDR